MHDCKMEVIASGSPHYKAKTKAEENMSDFCHILASVSHKAKRISSSTSTAETLNATLGKELGQMVAIRLTEVFGVGIQTEQL